MFLYFRVFVEPRKLRVIISILQYDCNLEDKEVRQLMGINNARIHSCRLRSNFHEWYSKNLGHSHAIFDRASSYLNDRQLKTRKLNEKIKFIDVFQRNRGINPINLDIFKEEFRTNEDFIKYHPIFKIMFYLSSVGKPSNLSGLPDEALQRRLMDIYKEGLFKLQQDHSIIFLFYYGTEEPENIMNDLLKKLSQELMELDQNTESVKQFAIKLHENKLIDGTHLTDKLYSINRTLFNYFAGQKYFVNMMN